MGLLERLGFSFRRNTAPRDDAAVQKYSDIESVSALKPARRVLAGSDYQDERPTRRDDGSADRHLSDRLSIWSIY